MATALTVFAALAAVLGWALYAGERVRRRLAEDRLLVREASDRKAAIDWRDEAPVILKFERPQTRRA